jgi:adenosine deaminase
MSSTPSRTSSQTASGTAFTAIEDMKAVEMLIERGITLEVNPWSNYLTNSVPTIEAHPLKKLFDLGVRVTINSDDPEVLETNVNEEYRIAHEVLGMSMADIHACNRFAFESSFIDKAKTDKIWNKYFVNIAPDSN